MVDDLVAGGRVRQLGLAGNRKNLKSLEDLYKKESPCNLTRLRAIESQFENLTRRLIVSPDRKRKLNPVDTALMPSRTVSLYYQASNEAAVSNSYCAICVNGVWSNISVQCTLDFTLNYCERDQLDNTTGWQFLLDDGSLAAESQDLFGAGSVMAQYEFSETTRLCKACLRQGREVNWSRYAETYYCNPAIAYFRTELTAASNLYQRRGMTTCKLKDLKLSELSRAASDNNNNNEYTRVSIQTWDGKGTIISDRVDDFSMAVYTSKQNEIRWCRKCNGGRWDENYVPCPVEFTINKCDPGRVRSVSYFVYTWDGARLSADEAASLVYPGQVAAVYEFGVQKYCKLCNDDGSWSSYPQFQLCDYINWQQ
jgi:hypothetical protein